MDYEYDIFISYRRQKETRGWIEDHFIPILKHHINLEIGRDPIFFLDTEIEKGTSWPNRLGQKIGTSRTIIPLWTGTFLNSKWCSCELGHMLERESKHGFRIGNNANGLVFPTIIHDGEESKLPVQLRTIQYVEIQDCYNIRMTKDSPKAELLAEKLEPLAKSIALAIENAPKWKQDWQIEAITEFVETFHLNEDPIQRTLPKHT